MSNAFDEEGHSGDAAEDQPKKRFSGKKLVLFVLLPFLLIVGTAAGLYFSGLLDKLLGKEHKEAAAPVESKTPVFIDMPDMLVNLNSKGSRPNFLKIKIKLQVASLEEQLAMSAVMPRIVDSFQVYLRELRVDDLKGSSGLYRLREELLRRVTTAAYPVRIKDVLFGEMLVQ